METLNFFARAISQTQGAASAARSAAGLCGCFLSFFLFFLSFLSFLLSFFLPFFFLLSFFLFFRGGGRESRVFQGLQKCFKKLTRTILQTKI